MWVLVVDVTRGVGAYGIFIGMSEDFVNGWGLLLSERGFVADANSSIVWRSLSQEERDDYSRIG